MRVPYGEYLPDLPALGNPGATVAKNVLPAANSYRPMPSLTTFSAALAAAPMGGFSVRDKAGNVYNYVGTSTKLYSLEDTAWTDVTLGAGTYTATDGQWRFIKWGEQVIAVNGPGGNAPQAVTLSGTSTAFANLAGSPPAAACIARVRDFVVLGRVDDGTRYPERVKWSGIADETTWTPSATTQADQTDLLGGGKVLNIVGGEYGVVLQEQSIWRMTYVGSPVIWQFDEILPNRGCLAAGSVAQAGDFIFYLSHEGFNTIVNGNQIQDIGINRVDRTVLADLDLTNLDRVYSVADQNAHIYCMIYPGAGNTSGRPNRMVCFDYGNQRWTLVEDEIEVIYTASAQGYTLDTLDNVNASIDALTDSLDSKAYIGGLPQVAAIDDAYKLGFFEGSPMVGVLETPEVQLFQDNRAFVRAVRPLVDGGTSTVQLLTRNRQQDSTSSTGAVSVDADGDCPFRSDARYHRVRVNWTPTASTQHALGVDIEASPSGDR